LIYPQFNAEWVKPTIIPNSDIGDIPVKLSVILAHPSRTSFNHAIAHTAVSQLQKNGHEVIFHDLYEEKFDPLLLFEEIPKKAELTPEVELHCKEIASADGIIIVHPNWWGQPPAILKGWTDRVLRSDVAYRFLDGDNGEGIPVGLLKAEAAIVFNTSNTPLKRETEIFGDPLELLWKMCIFDLCGVKSFYRRMFGVMVTSTSEQRKQWLEEVREVMNRFFP
jgi:NAD(P)H dehydrogenase (quinone)